MLDLQLLDAGQAADQHHRVLAVWEQAFGPVEHRSDWRSSIFHRHRGRADYRLALARWDRELVGFAWGYTGERGQYWTDLVHAAVEPAVAAEWVGGHFELVELAVAPTHRRQGIAGALHDLLLEGIPHRRALLGTTSDEGDPAVRLYRGRGWQRLGTLPDGAQVMARRLPGP